VPDRNKILIVEDEPLVAMHLEAELEALGYEILGIAVSAEEAANLTEQEPPGLALVDINIRGDRDGVAVADELNKKFATQVIFMSGMGKSDPTRRGRSVTPLANLPKPWTGGELERVVKLSSVKASS